MDNEFFYKDFLYKALSTPIGFSKTAIIKGKPYQQAGERYVHLADYEVLLDKFAVWREAYVAIRNNHQVSSRLVRDYEEQNSTLDVTFKCENGDVKCNKMVLVVMSEFFEHKINGFDLMNNPYLFDYTDYDKSTVKLFLDYCYSLPKCLENMKLATLLDILKFVHYEGKTVISNFEKKFAKQLEFLIIYEAVPSTQYGITQYSALPDFYTICIVAAITSKFDNPSDFSMKQLISADRNPIQFEIVSEIYRKTSKKVFNEEHLLATFMPLYKQLLGRQFRVTFSPGENTPNLERLSRIVNAKLDKFWITQFPEGK